MSFLYFLESIRNPVLDAFFSVVTHFGEETLFIIIGLFLFWCVDKKQGYYILSIGFIGIVLNQFLKIFYRVPRPWVKDPSFTIVESARAEATGYSFPSGHTQSSVGLFGAIARWNKNKILKITSIVLCVLVPLSRLYLGVHTPLDVGVSLVIAAALIFGLYPLITKCFENKCAMRILFSVMVLLSLGLVAFVSFYRFPSDVDVDNLKNATENGYKMLGCTLGVLVSFEIDNRFIRFETNGSFPSQMIKFLCGIIPVLLIKGALKSPLYALFAGSPVADGVRYFLILVFVGCIWPLTFKHFSKLFKKSRGVFEK